MLRNQLRIRMTARAKAGSRLNCQGRALRVVVVASKHQRRAWIRRRSRTGTLQQGFGFASPTAVEQKFAEGCQSGRPTRIERKRFTQGGFCTGSIPKRLLGTGKQSSRFRELRVLAYDGFELLMRNPEIPCLQQRTDAPQ